MSYILGKKLKMTQIWKDGKVVPVTVVHAEPNKVSIVRTEERDGYEAVQLSLGKKKREFKNRPNQKVDVSALKVDDAIGVDSFDEGDKVRVSGITKGRGFAGRRQASQLPRRSEDPRPEESSSRIRVPSAPLHSSASFRAAAWPDTWAWIASLSKISLLRRSIKRTI